MGSDGVCLYVSVVQFEIAYFGWNVSPQVKGYHTRRQIERMLARKRGSSIVVVAKAAAQDDQAKSDKQDQYRWSGISREPEDSGRMSACINAAALLSRGDQVLKLYSLPLKSVLNSLVAYEIALAVGETIAARPMWSFVDEDHVSRNDPDSYCGEPRLAVNVSRTQTKVRAMGAAMMSGDESFLVGLMTRP